MRKPEVSPDTKSSKKNKACDDSVESLKSAETADIVGHDEAYAKKLAAKDVFTQFSQDSPDNILGFNFNDFNPGSQYDVVIDTDGNSAPIQAPEATYYRPP